MHATALIAEDEALLAADLRAQLLRLWPGLEIVATVGDGASAAERALALQPDLLFLDIRMPGMSGLEAAQALAEDWPDGGRPFPLIVFVTAYDNYALPAFEHAAADYVLKPAQPERLAKTCARLQAALGRRAQAQGAAAWEAPLDQLRALLQAGVAQPPVRPAPLQVIQASAGNTISLVPVDEVIYFEAADKYVRVVTATHEHLIRMTLRELQLRLDPAVFWQVHRSTIVRCTAIASAVRDDAGRLTLHLRGHGDTLSVSRLYADLFRAM
ncbi:DNA-binding response regulator [Cupriavidus sp. USMAA2-4]|uniref:LytR/AlgR family response regulator transcription factor n=1 Tax=Cupriavidus sp. USMAA2-4 TaxID=876364 RepID=UPI0008A67F9F|nr:LytTR family DNA-binding domain-containing protein [Cupriavidus sp. USMAA2-4]AOY95600.1 DNA-binding response regulator [Cupriavidus sp. USMAA2-4]